MGYVTPQDAIDVRKTSDNNERAFGREHPYRIPLYCKLLAYVATQITGDPDEGTTAKDILRMANQITRPNNHCYDQVAAAFPQTEPAQRALANAAPCNKPISICYRLRPHRPAN